MHTPALNDVQATLLMPLWARAVESRRPNPVFCDPHSVELCDQVRFDFSHFVRRRVDTLGYCMRAAIFDALVGDFLRRHPDGRIVELGVGLDVRHLRLDNGRSEWLQIDLPDAIALRRRFVSESSRVRMWAGSATNPDWMVLIDAHDARPVMVTADAMFFFLDDEAIRNLLSDVARRFPGAEFVFDAADPEYLRYCNRRHPLDDSRLGWSLRRVSHVKRWSDAYRLEQYVGFGDSPYYDAFRSRMPWWLQSLRTCLPALRHAYKIMRWSLGGTPPPSEAPPALLPAHEVQTC
jgi:O-methyltransferase involved in polyketide biosynthesis